MVPDDPRHYMDFTGTGNTVDSTNPAALRLIMDSLRYWVTDCHVDGFRFDLASTLARESIDYDRRSGFLVAINQDPTLSQVKLIAEPWDVGPGGYQLGNFPAPWTEWNGKFRDAVRDFWKGQSGVAEFASRVTGSSDLYQSDGRGPLASVNLVTSHDGFTLRDLVSYDHKHNEANGEENRDGSDDNRSWNCGVEGPTDEPAILALRERQQRNLLTHAAALTGRPDGARPATSSAAPSSATTTPGARTTRSPGSTGSTSSGSASCYHFTRRLIALRQAHPVFRRTRFFTGSAGGGGPAGRLVVPPRRPPHDPAGLAPRGRRARSGSS